MPPRPGDAPARLVATIPVLASLDITRSVSFYRDMLGFVVVHAEPGVYAVLSRDDIQLHLWSCAERRIAENTSCRVQVKGLDSLYAEYAPKAVLHPNASDIRLRPWGAREFVVLDDSGNCITFFA
jgi:catechol 2,3-dioxygenase-like lactoylglutathione lyase family enzyme